MNAPPRSDKFRRYREKKRAQGLREVRLWVPDLRNPEVRARLEREAEMMRGSVAEKDAMNFIEAVMADDADFYG